MNLVYYKNKYVFCVCFPCKAFPKRSMLSLVFPVEAAAVQSLISDTTVHRLQVRLLQSQPLHYLDVLLSPRFLLYWFLLIISNSRIF